MKMIVIIYPFVLAASDWLRTVPGFDTSTSQYPLG